MLTIKIHNIYTNAKNIADYEWYAFINREQTDGGLITGFDRNKGWKKLVEEIIKDNQKGENNE